MRLASRRNPLAYPGGRNPCFDPTHIAATNIRFSAVAAQGGGFINLLTGQPTTPTNGTPTSSIRGGIGPAVLHNTSTVYNSVANPMTETPAAVTLAAIVIPTASLAAAVLVSDQASTGGHESILRLISLVPELIVAGGGVTSGMPALSIGVPYFIAVAANGVAQNFIAANLATGQISVGSSATSRSFASLSGAYAIGGYGTASTQADCYIAAAMMSRQFMSAGQLLAWAQSPWDFWYPPTAFDAMLSMLASGSQASSLALYAVSGAFSRGAPGLSARSSVAARAVSAAVGGAAQASSASVVARSATSGLGRAGPSGSAAFAARALAASAGRGIITSGATIAAAARGLSAAAGRATIAAHAGLSARALGVTAGRPALAARAQIAARSSTASRGSAAPMSGLQLIAVAARGLSASAGRAALSIFGSAWEPTARYGVLLWAAIYGALVAPLIEGAVAAATVYGVVAPSTGNPMSQQLPDFPDMVAGLQAQTLWVDFGRFLPMGTTLSGTPTLAVSVNTYSSGSDPSPSSRITSGPAIGTISTALGGTGLTNTALLFQLSNLQPGVTYLLSYSCGRSDGSDKVAGFNHIHAQAPG